MTGCDAGIPISAPVNYGMLFWSCSAADFTQSSCFWVCEDGARKTFPELSLSKTSRQAGSVPAGLISLVYLEYFQQTLVKKQMVKNSVHDELAGSSFRRFSE